MTRDVQAQGHDSERRVTAETRFRDADGGLRRVTASAPSAAAARRRLQEKLLRRAGEGHGGAELRAASSFADLADEWLSDLDLRELADGTKQLYRDHLRLHVLPAFEQYALAEITTPLHRESSTDTTR